MSVISVAGLRKTYGATEAVRDLSFEVHEGEVYALLGHNGAGKSTTVEILEGHRQRTSGEISVLGMDPARGGRELRDRIGIVLQSSGIEPELTVREAVLLYGSCYRTPRPLGEVIGLVGLDDKVDARIGSLSGGQRRRIDLALGIVGRPEVVFLDEPTTGFDAGARRRSWELVRSLCADGTTVLLTTPYLDEAEHLADRVGVMVNGSMVAEGTPDELIGATPDTVVSFVLDPGTDLAGLTAMLPALAHLGGGTDGGRIEFRSATPTADVHAVTSWALERDIELRSLSVHRPSLEDVFLELSSTDGQRPADVPDAPNASDASDAPDGSLAGES
jgi:ABC-2 type transport system ATP-binding protein